MSLSSGSRLGPYEILAPLGSGGMGEVYRAKDARLGREVAIKVLPASFSADADRLRRFEQEARAAGILNHPNITAVYDIGSDEAGAPYVVTELLEGETLRSRMAGGALSPRKALDYALQIAHGLAAAHEKGIVHRDLKPENLFVTKDGRVKILDFGLAKLTHTEEGGQATNLPTATAGTEPGVVLGTLGYMSPEQVRGRPADARSDIFSFGAILYEMLSGKRAFHGDSAADTMSAILREDPPDLSVTNQNVSPGLERVVRHCLEKNPEERFHSAHDLAFDLESVSGVSSPAQTSAAAPRTRARSRNLLLAIAGALVLAALAFLAGRRTEKVGQRGGAPVIHRRLTFRRGNVLFARFSPDGQNVVYSAAWGDRPAEIFLAHVGSPESRPLGIANANLLSVSSTGELAILLKKTNVYGTVGGGTLARVPLTGGAPREILDDVNGADWSPDGGTLAVLRPAGGQTILEYPIGRRLYSSANELRGPWVAPDGKSVLVVEGSPSGDRLTLVDSKGAHRTLTEGWLFIDSASWHRSGQEVWFVGVNTGTGLAIRAVDLAGKARIVAPLTDIEVLHDIARDGQVLVEREVGTREIFFSSNGEPERNLSWLDQSNAKALSPDGRVLLSYENGEGGGERGSVYLRRTDGSPAVRLGDGEANDLSPDGKWVLSLVPGAAPRLVLLPTGAGEPRAIDAGPRQVLGGVFLPPDGRRLAIGAVEPKRGALGYVLEPGVPLRPFTPEGLTGAGAASPDGDRIVFKGSDEKWAIYPTAGGAPRALPGLESKDHILQWSADSETLYVTRFGDLPLDIFRYRISTGTKELWKKLIPADRAGLVRIENVVITRDGKSYAYSQNRVLASDLFVVSGWK